MLNSLLAKIGWGWHKIESFLQKFIFLDIIQTLTFSKCLFVDVKPRTFWL